MVTTGPKADSSITSHNPIAQIFAFAETKPLHPAISGARLNLNYKTFVATVQRFAAKLRSEGLRPGHVVGLRLRPELQAVAIAAIMHEGAVSFSATGSIVESYSDAIDFVLTEDTSWLSKPRDVILINADWISGLSAINHQIDCLEFKSADALALLVFSSGTTGVPKGVEFSIDSIRLRTDAAERNWMPFKPFFAELGLDTVSGIQTYFWSLLHGETYFLPGSAEDNVRLIQEHGIRSIKTSPSKLFDLISAADEAKLRLDLLREVQVAGGLLNPVTARRLTDVSGADLYYLYGSTEVGTVSKGRYSPDDPEYVGKVVAEAEVKITDGNNRVTDCGQSGSLQLRTAYQAQRYWLADEATDTGFHQGWFLPGDTAVCDEAGQLRVTGRIDELVNAAGVKINPAVLDAKLAGYQGITDIAAFGYKFHGNTEKHLGVAIVVANPISIDRLQMRIRELFPDIHHVAIMDVREIPRNALGKPLRVQLAKAYILELSKNET